MEKGYLLILYIYPIPLPPNFHVLLMNLIIVSVESLEFCKDTIINYFIYQFYYINSEKAMASHSSTLAWKNPMDQGAWWAPVHGVAKSPARLSNFTCTFHFHALEKEMATHSSILAWRIPEEWSLVGCHLWGHTESDMTEAT